MSAKLIKKTNGEALYLGIIGTKQERNEFLNSLYNWGNWTPLDFHYNSELELVEQAEQLTTEFGATTLIFVSIKKLVEYFKKLNELTFDPERLVSEQLTNFLYKKAFERFEAIPENNFFTYSVVKQNITFHNEGVEEGMKHFATLQ